MIASAECSAVVTIVVPARAIPPARGSPTRIEAL
jgi:hypothetical protein